MSGKYRRGQEGPEGSRHLTDWDEPPVRDEEATYDVVDVLVEIAEGRGVSAAQVALAWLLGRPGVSSLVIGARTDEQLADNLAAADLVLADDERARLDEVSAPPLIYPHWHQAKTSSDRLSAGRPDAARAARVIGSLWRRSLKRARLSAAQRLGRDGDRLRQVARELDAGAALDVLVRWSAGTAASPSRRRPSRPAARGVDPPVAVGAGDAHADPVARRELPVGRPQVQRLGAALAGEEALAGDQRPGAVAVEVVDVDDEVGVGQRGGDVDDRLPEPDRCAGCGSGLEIVHTPSAS